jgi:DNA primase
VISRPLASTQKTLLAEALSIYRAAMPGSLAEEYAQEVRGLGPVIAEVHQLGYAGPGTSIPGLERFNNHLVIPYLAAGDGHPVKFKYRSLDPGHDKRYDAPKGQAQRLFNARAVLDAGDFICITEGEIDAMTLERVGAPALGIAGVSAWKPHFARLLEGFARVVLFKDNDEGGSKTDILEATIRKDAPDVPLLAVMVPGGYKDVNEAYLGGMATQLYELATGRKQ